MLFASDVMADIIDHDSNHIEKIVEDIGKSLPDKWSITEVKVGVIPAGHYWGLEYEGRKGFLVEIKGEMDVSIHWMGWKNEDGVWQREAIAKEVLQLWFMPRDYKESWLRFFTWHRPIPAAFLFSAQGTKVYAYPTQRIIDDERFREIIKMAKSFMWPDAPSNTGILSWKTWRSDLQKVLGKQPKPAPTSAP